MNYQGLNDAQVAESRCLHGENVLTPVKRDPLWKQFLRGFKDPLIVILLVALSLSVGIAIYEAYIDIAMPIIPSSLFLSQLEYSWQFFLPPD